jgi:hypothetical protein
MCRRDLLSALSGRDQHDLGLRREYAAGSLRFAERADLELPVTALPEAAGAGCPAPQEAQHLPPGSIAIVVAASLDLQ